MGKGDKRTAKGKRVAGSYGNARRHAAVTTATAVGEVAVKGKAAKRVPTAKKPAAKKAG